jgi:hypothetical protein
MPPGGTRNDEKGYHAGAENLGVRVISKIPRTSPPLVGEGGFVCAGCSSFGAAVTEAIRQHFASNQQKTAVLCWVFYHESYQPQH